MLRPSPHARRLSCEHLEDRRLLAAGPTFAEVAATSEFSARDTAEPLVFDGRMWLSNGLFHGNVITRDLWSSVDGVDWELVNAATPYDAFSELVAYRGMMWAIKESVWISPNGENWVQLSESTPFGARGYGEAVVFQDKIWQLGSGNDVWNTDDGVNWTLVAEDLAFGERTAAAVTVFNDRLWLMGGYTQEPNTPPESGYAGFTTHNDVWVSEDGITWEQQVVAASWAPRQWAGIEVYDGQMWLVGGYDNVHARNLGDVWHSADGTTWNAVSPPAAFESRHEPSLLVHGGSLWVAAGNAWPVQNDVWRLTEGLQVDFAEATPAAAFSPRDTAEPLVYDGRMWLSNGYYHGNVLTRDLWASVDGVDWELVNDATVYDPYSELVVYKGLMWAIKESVWISPNGVDWAQLSASTPFGSRGYGETVVFDGKIWQLGSGDDVWNTEDGVNWTLVADGLAYGERIAAAVTVFDDKLWLMGGYTEEPNTPPESGYGGFTTHNDVWFSEDGANWEQLVDRASWLPRQWAGLEVYAGQMWLVGGYDNVHGGNLGDVWYSSNGAVWNALAVPTAFEGRHEPSLLPYAGSLWVAAGNAWPVQNDVWRLTAF